MMKKKAKRNTPRPESPTTCSTCATIGAAAYGVEKYGAAEDSSYVPPAVGDLVTVRTLKDSGSRWKHLKQCPTCQDYFIHELDYEFLANGSEDEESVVRLKPDEACKLLGKRV